MASERPRSRRSQQSRARELFERIRADGAEAIDQLISEREREQLFIDFKRCATIAYNRLEDSDRKNLAKAISGFGNSEGGIIVWGVDTSGGQSDLASASHPVGDPIQMASLLETASGGCSIPPHRAVEHHHILINGLSGGYVVTYVPPAEDAPLRETVRNQYYIRIGSNFEPIPHGVLAGMFGRRPQPNVFPMYATSGAEYAENGVIIFDLVVKIANNSSVVASDIYLSLSLRDRPNKNFKWKFVPTKMQPWFQSWDNYGVTFHSCSNEAFRLPPQAFVPIIQLRMAAPPPYNSDLDIEGVCGCSGGPPFHFSLTASAEDLRGVTDDSGAQEVEKNMLAITSAGWS